MSDWIKFEPQPTSTKTAVVRVVSKSQDSVLGTIRWYGPWRQYVFYPAAACLFSRGCLEDVNEAIRDLMFARKPGLRAGAAREGD